MVVPNEKNKIKEETILINVTGSVGEETILMNVTSMTCLSVRELYRKPRQSMDSGHSGLTS